jgi:hypothetical protein
MLEEKQMNKVGTLALMILLAILAPAQQAWSAGAQTMGTVISSVSRLDLSSGRISGQRAMYHLELPSTWVGYMIADREKIANGEEPLDKLNFYYKPMNRIDKPVPVLTLNVYSIYGFTLDEGQRLLLETNKYCFTVWTAENDPLPNKTDQAIYSELLKNAKDDQYLIGLIRLSAGDKKVYRNTIWVNGKQLKVKSISEGNSTYLPIRETCEQLGYAIGWDEAKRAVTIKRDEYSQTLMAEGNSAKSGFNILIKNDRSFISYLYFIYYMGLNVEIDESSNVLVNEF